MNKFIFGALYQFSLKQNVIEYPKKVSDIRFSHSQSIFDYYKKNLRENAFLLSQNCACHIRATKNDNFELESLSLTCVFVKSLSLKKANENSFWKYIRIDIDVSEISDVYSHFLPHMHFFEERFKSKTPEEYRFAVPKITPHIIYDLLNIVYRTANASGWNDLLCSFAKQKGRSIAAQKINEANSYKDDIGNILKINPTLRKELIRARQMIDDEVVKCSKIASLDIPLSQVLLDCSSIF